MRNTEPFVSCISRLQKLLKVADIFKESNIVINPKIPEIYLSDDIKDIVSKKSI